MQESSGEPTVGVAVGDDAQFEPVIGEAAVRRVLSSDRRCRVLELLLEAGGSLSVGTLARRLVERDGCATTGVRQRVYLSLCRTHVPTLERHGFVEYCGDLGTVSLAIDDETVRELLAVAE
jgi:hypothetical protein